MVRRRGKVMVGRAENRQTFHGAIVSDPIVKKRRVSFLDFDWMMENE